MNCMRLPISDHFSMPATVSHLSLLHYERVKLSYPREGIQLLGEGCVPKLLPGAIMILSSISTRPAQVLGWGSGLVIPTIFGPSPTAGRNTSKPACKNIYWDIILIRHLLSGAKQKEREQTNFRGFGCKRT